MSRIVLGPGSRGTLVIQLQKCLAAAGKYSGLMDGIFGSALQQAVRTFQAASSQAPTGAVDEELWVTLTRGPLPSLQARVLEVTASFEGHGYGLAKGNFDGAFLTWGIVGFTLKSGSFTEVYRRIKATHPECVANAFANLQPQFEAMLTAPATAQLRWATANTVKGNLAEPWKSALARLGQFPEVQQIQREVVSARYYQPALATARRFGLNSELGVGLCFDIHVQNGSISNTAAALIQQQRSAGAVKTEQDLRIAMAHAVADCSPATFSQDVRNRKLTWAQGQGAVHGASYALTNWGIGEYPAEELNQKAKAAAA